MIIDFHTHTFPDNMAEKTIAKLSQGEGVPVYTKGTVSSLLSSSQKAEISLNVMLPVVTKSTQTERVNADAIAYNNAYLAALEKGQLPYPTVCSFGGIHPDNENYKDIIDNLHANHIIGIKLHPIFTHTDIDDIRYLRIIDYACEKDMLVNYHGGLDLTFPDAENGTPEHAINMLKKVKPENIICAHMGGWNSWGKSKHTNEAEILEYMLSEFKPLVDTSFCLEPEGSHPWFYDPLTAERFGELVDMVGVEHVLFGTDSPWTDQSQALVLLKSACRSDEEFEQITSKNACRLLEIAI